MVWTPNVKASDPGVAKYARLARELLHQRDDLYNFEAPGTAIVPESAAWPVRNAVWHATSKAAALVIGNEIIGADVEVEVRKVWGEYRNQEPHRVTDTSGWVDWMVDRARALAAMMLEMEILAAVRYEEKMLEAGL